jgi:hypothetical protein
VEDRVSLLSISVALAMLRSGNDAAFYSISTDKFRLSQDLNVLWQILAAACPISKTVIHGSGPQLMLNVPT